MRPFLSPDSNSDIFASAPTQIRTVRILGHGRAAQARLVDATLPRGETVRCVEKVFAPGLLTRTLYRLSFQSPFAYQSNRAAIATCFYRRRVAAAVVAAGDTDARVAEPLYIRFDESTRAWVLAATFVEGRGIRPEPVDKSRIRRWLSKGNATSASNGTSPSAEPEIAVLIKTMRKLENALVESGLVGSGWQVAPRAMVSTANLLRVADRYTIIDLESGIPAVLVPKYVFGGMLRSELPPFDDLDPNRLCTWYAENERSLKFRLGRDRFESLRTDIDRLIEFNEKWKASEIALFRRPWRLFRRGGMSAYQTECLRRWKQNQTVDDPTFESLTSRTSAWTEFQVRLLWWLAVIPGPLGRLAAKLVGNECFRDRVIQCVVDPELRKAAWDRRVDRDLSRWIRSSRIAANASLHRRSYLSNWLLSKITPAPVHRFVSDSQRRRQIAVTGVLLLTSTRYQTWFGTQKVASAINAWERSQRIGPQEAEQLRRELSGDEVHAYVRGFGMHLSLKVLAPIVVSAKVGGIATFLATGNVLFLLPMVMMPVVRFLVTLESWFVNRNRHIPHGEAMAISWLPTLGTMAFLLQMIATRPALSTFLIRDAFAKLGRRVPIYGGPDSRTEIAMIGMTDYLIEAMQFISSLASRVTIAKKWRSIDSGIASELKTLKLPTTRWGRWVERQASLRIDSPPTPESTLAEEQTSFAVKTHSSAVL